ncbi:MAG: DUF1513 domain-containing protein [Minwuia sp.]|uniref:DUF1513 domain-containing protein n=1 Tax=Minwuia sp. TaxID=2493630 RepID=UPI003A8ABF18
MAIDRRNLLKGMAAATLLLPHGAQGRPSGARFIASRRTPGGDLATVFGADGSILASHRLPDRGHGAAVSEDGRAVIFARRPGRFALVLSMETGRELARIEAPADRHFYGHGFFSADGGRLYATENDFGNARGVLGVYDASAGHARIGELDTYGTGPHQVLPMHGGRHAVVANGGIETHPDWPRRKLNLPAMRPSLALIDLKTGALADSAELGPRLHALSIRHIALAGGEVWFGCQDEAPGPDPRPLVGVYRPGAGAELIETSADPAFRAYIGSVAASHDGRRIATTSPRGGVATVWSAETRRPLETWRIPDVCGVAACGTGFVFTDGLGRIWRGGRVTAEHAAAWDNHIAGL